MITKKEIKKIVQEVLDKHKKQINEKVLSCEEAGEIYYVLSKKLNLINKEGRKGKSRRYINDVGDQYTRMQIFLIKSCSDVLKKIDQRLKNEVLEEASKKKKEENTVKKSPPQSIQFTMFDYLTKFEPYWKDYIKNTEELYNIVYDKDLENNDKKNSIFKNKVLKNIENIRELLSKLLELYLPIEKLLNTYNFSGVKNLDGLQRIKLYRMSPNENVFISSEFPFIQQIVPHLSSFEREYKGLPEPEYKF